MAEIISELFGNISAENLQNANSAANVWRKILFSMDKGKTADDDFIQNRNGENLFYHSKIIERKNGVLLIEVDHPGWIQLFQLSQKYILRGFKKFAPELGITALSFCLAGRKR
jgi:uncharacterized Fe-S cluster-containing protein